jgi:hypothetical protein
MEHARQHDRLPLVLVHKDRRVTKARPQVPANLSRHEDLVGRQPHALQLSPDLKPDQLLIEAWIDADVNDGSHGRIVEGATKRVNPL